MEMERLQRQKKICWKREAFILIKTKLVLQREYFLVSSKEKYTAYM